MSSIRSLNMYGKFVYKKCRSLLTHLTLLSLQMNLSVTLKSSLCWILESLCLDRNAPAFIQIGQEAVW